VNPSKQKTEGKFLGDYTGAKGVYVYRQMAERGLRALIESPLNLAAPASHRRVCGNAAIEPSSKNEDTKKPQLPEVPPQPLCLPICLPIGLFDDQRIFVRHPARFRKI